MNPEGVLPQGLSSEGVGGLFVVCNGSETCRRPKRSPFGCHTASYLPGLITAVKPAFLARPHGPVHRTPFREPHGLPHGRPHEAATAAAAESEAGHRGGSAAAAAGGDLAGDQAPSDQAPIKLPRGHLPQKSAAAVAAAAAHRTQRAQRTLDTIRLYTKDTKHRRTPPHKGLECRSSCRGASAPGRSCPRGTSTAPAGAPATQRSRLRSRALAV
eukprot:scaffold48854_cov63-Phaeocystis_antarctica.AAC.1